MKILMISSHFPPAWDWGGPPRSMWTLARGLAGLGVDVKVLTTNAKQCGVVDVPSERVEHGVRIVTKNVLVGGHSRAANRHGISPALWSATANAIGAADLVHLNEFWGPSAIVTALSCAIARKPYLVSARGRLECRSLAAKSVKKQLALALGIKRLLQRASSIHFTTELERNWSPPWAAAADSIVVPNPVEFGDGLRPSGLGGWFDLTDRSVVVGLFGRIHPRKGFDVLIPALARARLRTDLRLLVVGPDEANHRFEIIRDIERHGLADFVKFTGPMEGSALEQAYAAVDLLALPSHGESFGNVIVEAASQGTPCITSDQVGLKRWVAQHDAGIVLPLDVNVWANALADLDPPTIRTRWSRDKLRDAAEQSFAPKVVAAQMLMEYERLVDKYQSWRRTSSVVANRTKA